MLAVIVVVTATDLVVRHAFGGLVGTIAIFMINIGFLFFVAQGFFRIRRNDSAGHRESMKRGVGILMFFTVQRPFFIGLSGISNMEVTVTFLVAGGLALVTTMFVAECWIQHTRKKLAIGRSNSPR